MNETNERRVSPALIVIIFVALALRLFQLGRQSLWYDEGVSFYMTRLGLAEMMRWTAYDIQPPLYYLILRLWVLLFGPSEFSLRFPSLIFGLLTVPLVYLVGRRLFDRATGLVAAALAAIAPLYLWYSQEARMYTLLTFLCLLSSYLLLLAIDEVEPKKRRFLWLALALTDALALYTHYFAAFVIVFQALYFLLAWGRSRERSRLLAGALALVGIVLLYLPWLPFAFIRYGTDVSYWGGTLKLNEVLRKLVISFSLGESVIEATAAKLAIGYVVIFLIAVALIAVQGSRVRVSGLFLLLYLLVPVVLIVAFVYRNPKFNPRYLMLASPPALLIVAAGLVILFRKGTGTKNAGRVTLLLAACCCSLCSLFILGTMAYADYNLYFDVRFTKPDFRGVARYLDEHQEPDEAIILASGHAYPVFTYYYQGDNWHPIPPQRTLSTVNTLNYGLADDLNRILKGQKGVWAVLWQDEVVDPNGFLTAMLDEGGEALPVEASFYHVQLRHYALSPGARFSSEPAIEHPLAVNFGDKIDLLGYGQPRPGTVTLYWRARSEMEEDYKVSLRLRDEDGHYWHRRDRDRRPAADLYPTMRWKPGEVLFGKYEVPVLPGTPPGEYWLEAVLYSEAAPEALDVLDENGAPRGKSALLGMVTVPRAEPPPTREELGIQNPLEANFEGRLALLGYEIGSKIAQPGDRLYIMLFWQAVAEVAEDYTLVVRLDGEEGQTFLPANTAYPTSRWTAGEVVRGQYDFDVPVGAEPGQASLQVGLVDGIGEIVGQFVTLTDLEVEATERVFTIPETQYPSGANFGEVVTLIGADLDATTVEPGGTLHLTLYWQARARMETSYTVFTHLLGDENRIWAQKDSLPAGGERLTTGWAPGEVIRDDYELVVKNDAPPGEYVVEVGLYDASRPDFPRLPVLDESGETVDTRVIVVDKVQVE